VHDHLVETRHAVEQCVVDFVCDGVRLGHRQPGIDEDLYFGVQAMADPAQAKLIDALHARDASSDTACMPGAAAFLTLEDRVDEAVPLFAEAADIARASGNRYALRLALTFGDVASGRLLDAEVDTDADVAGRARRALELSHEFSSGFVAYLVGLVLAAHRAGQADDAALVAGYLSTHGDDLGVAAATVERLAAGGSLARFAEGDAAASYERGRTLTTDQLLAVLEQLAT